MFLNSSENLSFGIYATHILLIDNLLYLVSETSPYASIFSLEYRTWLTFVMLYYVAVLWAGNMFASWTTMSSKALESWRRRSGCLEGHHSVDFLCKI